MELSISEALEERTSAFVQRACGPCQSGRRDARRHVSTPLHPRHPRPLVNPGADRAAASPSFSPALSPLGDRQRSCNFLSSFSPFFSLSSSSSTQSSPSLLARLLLQLSGTSFTGDLSLWNIYGAVIRGQNCFDL